VRVAAPEQAATLIAAVRHRNSLLVAKRVAAAYVCDRELRV
jgi:hypothetical protein